MEKPARRGCQEVWGPRADQGHRAPRDLKELWEFQDKEAVPEKRVTKDSWGPREKLEAEGPWDQVEKAV